MHEVIKCNRVLEEIVNTAQDTENTKRIDPNTDDGDDAGLFAVLKPTEDGEESSNDINEQDGTRQLPRRNRGPKRTVGASNEDKPVLSEGNLQEQDLITITKVLNDTAIITSAGEHSGKCNPGTNSKDKTEKDRHAPELGQVPLDRRLGEGRIVVGDGQGSQYRQRWR